MYTGVAAPLRSVSTFWIFAEVAWLVALRSLPCHWGSSYLAGTMPSTPPHTQHFSPGLLTNISFPSPVRSHPQATNKGHKVHLRKMCCEVCLSIYAFKHLGNSYPPCP